VPCSNCFIYSQTKVTKVTREHRFSKDPKEMDHARWVINDGQDGIFDAVIVTVGTCGEPHRIPIDGIDFFGGKTYHSSELDDADLEGKKVVIIGSGASGVEAAELAVEKQAQSVNLIARDDKWIIPRNVVIDTFLAMQPFGRQMPLSFLWEWFIKIFHYRGLKNLAPPRLGIFEGTPASDSYLFLAFAPTYLHNRL
jgi:dimethylaniline monooxygenase (N-oxide forming)